MTCWIHLSKPQCTKIFNVYAPKRRTHHTHGMYLNKRLFCINETTVDTYVRNTLECAVPKIMQINQGVLPFNGRVKTAEQRTIV